MTFPSCGNPPDANILCYLAEISIRGLLNRVHNSLYQSGQPRTFNAGSSTGSLVNPSNADMSLPSMISICAELQRQLDTWYRSIPEMIRPSLGLGPLENDRQQILRIRYYSAGHIIHRPFVLQVVSNPDEMPSQMVMENCQRCLESCRLYVQNTSHILMRPSQYTWTVSQSSVPILSFLSSTSRCPAANIQSSDL